ncbi:MAG: DUF6000 family protein [Planctomycetota bacterium]
MDTLTPAGDEDLATWELFDSLIAQLDFTKLQPDQQKSVWGVFERAPDTDNDFTWGVLHLLESVPAYEVALYESFARAPSTLSILMIRRIVNAGFTIPDEAETRLVTLSRGGGSLTAAASVTLERLSEQARARSEEPDVWQLFDRYVRPFYLGFHNGNYHARSAPECSSFLTAASSVARAIGPADLSRLLSVNDWRHRLVGAYFVGIARLEGHEREIIDALNRNELGFTANGQVFALMRLGTPRAIRSLEEYASNHWVPAPTLEAVLCVAALRSIDRVDEVGRIASRSDRTTLSEIARVEEKLRKENTLWL